MLDRLYGIRLLTSPTLGWLADCTQEFNVYLPCQLQVKLIGTPSAPHTRRLGSVLGVKQIFPALAYVECENPSVAFSRQQVGGVAEGREDEDVVGGGGREAAGLARAPREGSGAGAGWG